MIEVKNGLAAHRLDVAAKPFLFCCLLVTKHAGCLFIVAAKDLCEMTWTVKAAIHRDLGDSCLRLGEQNFSTAHDPIFEQVLNRR